MNVDELDHRILEVLQYNFPLHERPFDILAQELGLDPELLWHRVQQMLEQGTIRRIGVSFNSKKLGRASTLAAIRVEPALVDRAAEVVGRFPEVTHSYLRDHEFNIWFTIVATDEGRIEAILGEIRRELSLAASDVLNLPSGRVFKLDARFRGRRTTI